MGTTQPKYNIKAVSRMIGIQPGTLRAWERRYQMICPVRNEAGHRLYTDDHIRILEWLKEKVNKGFTISQAVALLENNKDTLHDSHQAENRSEMDNIEEQLMDALLSFNEKKAQQYLDQAFSLFSPETVAIEIIGPILVKTGDLWEANKITSAHEHFSSHFLKSRIGMMLLSIPTAAIHPKALLVCGPNEKHELGLMIFALYLKRQGYDVVYLGQSIAGGDIDLVIDEISPAYLFMSCTLLKNISISLRLAESLHKKFPKLQIGLGGYAYDQLSEFDKKRMAPYVVGNNMKDWDLWLNKQ
ncbi:MerR family transcriptional regulator [Halobacillus rhizosphaerae]|uniref:MerR family transcriptional regulator n=1 Tax=Halobacillus rhizosphaerae TaxID=3064889 RepID=UPI00398BA4F4